MGNSSFENSPVKVWSKKFEQIMRNQDSSKNTVNIGGKREQTVWIRKKGKILIKKRGKDT